MPHLLTLTLPNRTMCATYTLNLDIKITEGDQPSVCHVLSSQCESTRTPYPCTGTSVLSELSFCSLKCVYSTNLSLDSFMLPTSGATADNTGLDILALGFSVPSMLTKLLGLH